jgi:hypothetical protein
LNSTQYEILVRIHMNGVAAMQVVANSGTSHSHNTSYFDLKIGMATTKMALELYKGKVPRLVEQFLQEHYEQETYHATMFELKKDELADNIGNYHQRILKNHGLISYLACMPLLGERMALAEAFYFHYSDDPHAAKDGFWQEFVHSSTPLILISMLEPSLEELEQALHDQTEFLELVKQGYAKGKSRNESTDYRPHEASDA